MYSESDSDEDLLLNTIGDIPTEWYDDYPHIGYTIEGKKLLKPACGDDLKQFLEEKDGPDGLWCHVKMPDLPNTQIKLNQREISMIRRIQQADYPDANFNPFEVFIGAAQPSVTSLSYRDEPKSRFLPSKWEHKKVMKLVYAIRQGWIKPKNEFARDKKPIFYNLWTNEIESPVPNLSRIPAPKMSLPHHSESYRPPSEYLLSSKEETDWKQKSNDDKRPGEYLPQQYSTYLDVPSYSKFYQERFNRCLDLYLCPRERKLKVQHQTDSSTLLPQLPQPKDLQPYPSQQSLVYTGHVGGVSSITVHPLGQYIASGGMQDNTVKLWEVSTGRCINTYHVKNTVQSVDFCPNTETSLLAVSVNSSIVLLNHQLYSEENSKEADASLSQNIEIIADTKIDKLIWNKTQDEFNMNSLVIDVNREISQVAWHRKGDYFASVQKSDTSYKSIYIHQLSRQQSQTPFSKSKGRIQCVSFHPTDPTFIIATMKHILIYDLVKQSLVKKLYSGVTWLSSISMHPSGTNIIAGSQDCKLLWFDLELSVKPYKTLRHHKGAIRSVAFHQKYPLFASCGDEGSIVVYHGMAYNDLTRNPLIVPLKLLRGHDVIGGVGALQCVFHSTQPWLFSAGTDGTIKLYT